MNDAVNLIKISHSTYIKMDVDRIEHLILKVLNNTKSILIEINDNFIFQASEANSYLVRSSFMLKDKTHAPEFDLVTTGARNTYNQIWSR